jgi:hypothetical protein
VRNPGFRVQGREKLRRMGKGGKMGVGKEAGGKEASRKIHKET